MADETTAAPEKYCVIGMQVTSVIERKWKDTPEEAIEHAKVLLRKNPRDQNRKWHSSANKLMVVKAIEVVEIAGPPVENRPPTKEDFANLDN